MKQTEIGLLSITMFSLISIGITVGHFAEFWALGYVGALFASISIGVALSQ